MPRVEYDVDVIRERLTVAAVLRAGGVNMIDNNTRRMRCPLHTGASNATEFSIFAAGRAYRCFACGAKGDALALVRWIWNESFSAAVARAAVLVGVAPGPVDPALRARRDAERERHRKQQAEARRVRSAEATRISTDYWLTLLCEHHKGRRWAHLHEYLHLRRMDGVLALSPGYPARQRIYRPTDRRLWHVLLPSEDGELALPILDDTEIKPDGMFISACGHPIVGVASRGVVRTVEHEHDLPVQGPIVAWGDRSPKVRCNTGGSTRGTFGSPHWVREGGRCVLVEGMADFVAAHLIYPDDAVHDRRGVHNAILGAHSAGMIEHAAAVACHRLGPGGELVLVTHRDDAGRDAERKAIAIALRRGIRVTNHDLGDHKDLADQVAAR